LNLRGLRSGAVTGCDQWRTQDFFSGGGGSTNSVEGRGENGDLGVVAP